MMKLYTKLSIGLIAGAVVGVAVNLVARGLLRGCQRDLGDRRRLDHDAGSLLGRLNPISFLSPHPRGAAPGVLSVELERYPSRNDRGSGAASVLGSG
jgi:hypothetical protein